MSNNTEGFKKSSLFPVLIIATLAIGLYSNTLRNDFVYDDVSTIVNNSFIKNFDNLPLLFDKTAYFSRSSVEMSYRPVVTFTYFIDYAFYGLKPWGYHLTNILLHAINGALLYFFLTLLFTPHSSLLTPHFYSSRFTSPPFLISLLFVTHPVLTEAVNGISYREDLLAFLFYMMTLNLYLILRTKLTTDHRPLTTALLYLFSCLTYLLALLSKEMAVTLPLIGICYEWLYGRGKVAAASCAADIRAALDAAATKINDNMPFRLFNRYAIGYIAITFFYLYLRFYLFHNPEEQREEWSMVERFFTLPWLIMNYLKLSLIPVHLSAYYEIDPVSSLFSLIFILSLISLVSVFTVILIIGNREKKILFGALFFLTTLTPVYNLVPIANPFAERYLYFPVAGFTMFAISITYLVAEKLTIRPEYLNRYVPIFVLIVLIIFSFSIVKRNTAWRDNYSLWSDTAAKVPNSAWAHHNFGNAYLQQNLIDQAIKEFFTAIRLNPNDAETHNNLGVAYYKQGRYDEAMHEFTIALKLKPDFKQAHHNLEVLEKKKGY